MQRSDLKEEDYRNILNGILKIIIDKGLKSATMDTVASTLGMSKRTLYEIFDSKEEMIREALANLEKECQDYYAEAFSKASNVIEGFMEVFRFNRNLVGAVNGDFYRDLDRLYKKNRDDYEKFRNVRNEKLIQRFMLGVEQGMFRPDIDYRVQSRMIGLQMEGLKRIEELFPPDITLQNVFDSITITFLRGIATPKGLEVLEREIERMENRKNTKSQFPLIST